MSDYKERACTNCGSFLHHEDNCTAKTPDKEIDVEAEKLYPLPEQGVGGGTINHYRQEGYIAGRSKGLEEIEQIKIKAKIEELEYQKDECEASIDKTETGDEVKHSTNDLIYDLDVRLFELKQLLKP